MSARSTLSVTKKAELECITNASKRAGYVDLSLIECTAMGAVYNGTHQHNKKNILIKASSIDLYMQQKTNYKQGKRRLAPADVLNEISIVQYLASNCSTNCPSGFPKFVDSFKSESHYFLITECEGRSLFDFVSKAHQLIKANALQICEWHRVVRVIFKQMLECVDLMHGQNVCHFDLTLENFSINDIEVSVQDANDRRIMFKIDQSSNQKTRTQNAVQIKLVDFAFAEHFVTASSSLRGDSSKDNELQIASTPFQSNKYCGKPHYMSPEMANKNGFSRFNAKSHDVWCLGVCLFIMCVGNAPFVHAKKDDPLFRQIMDGNLLFLLKKWNKLHFINPGIYEILEACLQYETYRISTRDLFRCGWMSK